MINKYRIGSRLEYKIVKILKKNLPSAKYTIIRSAGSRSGVDIFVIQHRRNKGFGIQCKSTLRKKRKKDLK